MQASLLCGEAPLLIQPSCPARAAPLATTDPEAGIKGWGQSHFQLLKSAAETEHMLTLAFPQVRRAHLLLAHPCALR